MSKVTPIRSGKRVNLFSQEKPNPTPVELLINKLRESLHIYNPRPLYALFGSVAANMLAGPPVWLMFVGAPSAGGSEYLNTLIRIPGLIDSGSIESSAAFLSGTSAKDVTASSTGGLLNQVGKHGGIILKDFTSILSLGPAERTKVMAVFREAYDGRWSRHVGSDGGKKLHWEGKVGFFAKCTGIIDQENEVSAALGERWIYHRLGDEGDEFARCEKALNNNSSPPTWRGDLQTIVQQFYTDLGLKFGTPSKEQRKPRALSFKEMDRTYRMGKLAAQCRSAVIRHRFRRDIIGIGDTEMAPRLTSALGQLYVGMETIGVREEDRWAVLVKSTFDSMPALRRRVIEGVVAGWSLDDIAEDTKVSRRVIRETAEDLEVHGVASLRRRTSGVIDIELVPEVEKEIKYVLRYKDEIK